MAERIPVPRDRDDDYSAEAAHTRREFARERTGVDLHHVGSYSVDPATLTGNVEHFTGVAQVPLGIAGPLLVNGEHAQGEFYVPLATAEGTLVASYNRGMRLLHEAGGVTVTVVDDHMQRAPSFLFENARGARDFGQWLRDRFADIKEVAESTTSDRPAPGHRAVLGGPHPLHALQLHDGRRRRPEPHGQGDAGRLPLDRQGVPGHRAVLPRVQLRDGQEDLAGQRAAHARQAGDRRGDDPQ